MPLIDLNGLNRFLFRVKQLIHGDGMIYTATSDDGVAYTVTVPGVTSLFAGLRITVQLSRTTASTAPTLNVNGLGAKGIRQPLTTNNIATATGVLNTWISSACPVVLTYTGSQWKTDYPRTSAAHLYGEVGIEKGGTGATNAEDALANLGGASLTYVQDEIARLEELINSK